MNNIDNNLKEILEANISKLTPDEWDNYFSTLRQHNIPSREKRLSRKTGSARLIGRNWSLSTGKYDGVDSFDYRYCSYINDVLKNIRSGKKTQKVDYCYKAYQVADLLRFEPNLKSKLIHRNGEISRIEVWLDKDKKK